MGLRHSNNLAPRDFQKPSVSKDTDTTRVTITSMDKAKRDGKNIRELIQLFNRIDFQ